MLLARVPGLDQDLIELLGQCGEKLQPGKTDREWRQRPGGGFRARDIVTVGHRSSRWLELVSVAVPWLEHGYPTAGFCFWQVARPGHKKTGGGARRREKTQFLWLVG